VLAPGRSGIVQYHQSESRIQRSSSPRPDAFLVKRPPFALLTISWMTQRAAVKTHPKTGSPITALTALGLA
jgi:hypothetical protein